MRLTSQDIGNGMAWIGIFGLIALAFCVVWALGFPGVLILGLLTTMICVRAELSDHAPTWGRAVFEARRMKGRSPEERAATQEAENRNRSPMRYYRRCGWSLVGIGLLGTVWTFWS